jgi:hypothetical protein
MPALKLGSLIIRLMTVVSFVATGSQALAAGAKDESSYSPPPPMKCHEILSDKRPFEIMSSVQPKDPKARPNLKAWEHFRDTKNLQKVVGYVPKASIVRLNRSAKMPDRKGQKTTYVSVEVLSLPSSVVDEKARKARNPIKDRVVGPGERVKAGAIGYVSADALDEVSGYTFIVNQDAPLFDLGGNAVALGGKSLKLAQTAEGKFRVNQCCVENSGGKPPTCADNYIFHIIDPNSKITKDEIALSTDPCCNVLPHLRVVRDDQVESLLAFTRMAQSEHRGDLATLEYIDSMGMVKLPIDAESGDGPFGSWHYGADKGNAISEDAYMNATSACAFMRVLEYHQKICRSPGCEIQWGDAFHPKAWQVHGGHESGTCIDLRPLKTVDNRDPQRISIASRSVYDWIKTKQLVERFSKAGATTIFFNDKRIPEAGWYAGHADHIHVCFAPTDQKVQDTCRSGYPKK